MSIDRRGTLGDASVVEAASPALRTAGECVLTEARDWTYQSSSSGRTAHYRISFANGPFVVSEVRPRR